MDNSATNTQISKIIFAAINKYNIHRNEMVLYVSRDCQSIRWTFVFWKRAIRVLSVNRLNSFKYAKQHTYKTNKIIVVRE